MSGALVALLVRSGATGGFPFVRSCRGFHESSRPRKRAGCAGDPDAAVATVAGHLFPAIAGDDAEGARGFADQPRAGGPLRILDKVREYLALAPNERELRLRATELRWYLTPLFKIAPADREASLAQVPDELRDLVKSRLARWDALSPQVQKEFLDNDRTLHYFARIETTNSVAANPEQQKIADEFNRFFEFTPEETQRALNTLSTAERAQMEKTLETFSKLPPAQRAQCIRAFTEFASMSPSDRAEFLKNAESWSKMPPKERQAWRVLVAEVPKWPPMPPTLLMPPVPPPPLPPNPRLAPRTQPVVATNHL